jgi:Protein of unknown function (DUF3667)
MACPSCGSDLQGRYCSACGERALSPRDFELKHFLLEQLPHEFLHVNGKLPRTLRVLLTQPGEMAVNYVIGKRQRFVSPLRLYLILFLLHAFIAVVLGGPGASLPERVRDFDVSGLLSHLLSSRPDVNWSSPAVASHVREQARWLSEVATLLLFLVMAAFQKILFYRLRRHYLEHVALALNVATFYLAVLLTGELLVAVATRHPLGDLEAVLQSLAALFALPIYWFLAIRRFYGIRKSLSAVSAILMTVAHAVIAVGLNTIVYAILIETT